MFNPGPAETRRWETSVAHLQVGGLGLVHDEAHQDVELLVEGERLPETQQTEAEFSDL